MKRLISFFSIIVAIIIFCSVNAQAQYHHGGHHNGYNNNGNYNNNNSNWNNQNGNYGNGGGYSNNNCNNGYYQNNYGGYGYSYCVPYAQVVMIRPAYFALRPHCRRW